MEFTIYISKNVFWFAAGIAASIVGKLLWYKLIVPGYIHMVEWIDERHQTLEDMKYERTARKKVIEEAVFDAEYNADNDIIEPKMIDPDVQEARLSRMKKRMKK